MTQEKIKATIYCLSDMGGSVMRREGFLIDHKLVDYAQYKNVPQIDFILKGKGRPKPIRFIDGYNPFYLILEGWDTPLYSDDEGFITSNDNGMMMQESKYLSCDSRYVTDFNRFINPLLKDNVIIADYRYYKDSVEIKEAV